jgi:hypothetical protein
LQPGEIMADITIAELAAGFSGADPLAAWWTAAAALPADTPTTEFFVRTLAAAEKAAATKNNSLPTGGKITAYASANGAITTDTSGILSFLRTASVSGRVAVSLLDVVATEG